MMSTEALPRKKERTCQKRSLPLSRIFPQTFSPCIIYALFFGRQIALKDSPEQMFAKSRRRNCHCHIRALTPALLVGFHRDSRLLVSVESIHKKIMARVSFGKFVL